MEAKELFEQYAAGERNFAGADLSDTNLYDAYLRGADLSDADLRDADLRDADLSRADLTGADLRRADLRGANLRRADLRRADLRRARILDNQQSALLVALGVNLGYARVAPSSPTGTTPIAGDRATCVACGNDILLPGLYCPQCGLAQPPLLRGSQ